jgi:hypothetical protein
VHSSREAILRIIGDADRILLVLSHDDRRHRSEDLEIIDGHAGTHVRENCGLVERSLVRTARREPCACKEALLDDLIDTGEDDRAEGDLLPIGIPDR